MVMITPAQSQNFQPELDTSQQQRGSDFSQAEESWHLSTPPPLVETKRNADKKVARSRLEQAKALRQAQKARERAFLHQKRSWLTQ